MRCLTLGLIALSFVTSCKKSLWGETKSYLGIEAAQKYDFSAAPTFVILSNWFNQKIIDEGTGKSIQQSASQLASYVQESMIRYIDSEIGKALSMDQLLATNNLNEVARRLDLESYEMYDIIAALVTPKMDHQNLRTDDFFAHFIVEGRKNQVSGFNQYFLELRKNFVDRQGASIDYIMAHLEVEREKFSAKLRETYLGNDAASKEDALRRLRSDNAENLASLRSWKSALQQNGANVSPPKLKGAAAGFVGAYGQMMGASSMPDKLPPIPGIEQIQDDGGPGAAGGPSVPYTPPTVSVPTCPYGQYAFSCAQSSDTVCIAPGTNPSVVCSLKALNDALAKLPSGGGGGASTGGTTNGGNNSGNNGTANGTNGLNLASAQSNLPAIPKPRFSCDDRGYRGNAKYYCEYYAAIQPAVKLKSTMTGGSQNSGIGIYLGSTRGVNYLLKPGIATVVNEQDGPSCAANGLMQTADAIIAAQTKQNTNKSNADVLWQMHVAQDPAGGQNGANMEEMIKLAMSGGGTFAAGKIKGKITGYRPLKSVDDIKNVLSKSPRKAVYAGSDIGDSWVGGGGNNVSGGSAGSALDCQGGVGGHAYSLYGFDDTGFYVRNSWGDTWGFKGNHKIPFECFSKGGDLVEMYEIDVSVSG